MRVIQLSDLHLGPTTHPDGTRACNNERAWRNAERVAALLHDQPDADRLVIVVTGDLTDEGHVNPEEHPPAEAWLRTLPGTVLVVPGNHDVGNFPSARATPVVNENYLAQWDAHVGADRFVHTADGHRLIGLNSMLYGSGLPAEAEQDDWLDRQLAAAASAGEGVWVFQHTPLFLRDPAETRADRECYWCPAAGARDRVLRLLDRPHFRGIFHGHIHRRFDQRHADRLYRSCPALSGTHTDADYFLRDPDVHRHDLGVLNLDHARVEIDWQPTGFIQAIRYAG